MTKTGSSYYMGIDPGLTGGIAVVGEDRSLVMSFAMPRTERDILELIQEHAEGTRAVIEIVHAMPGNGVSSMFRFGENYGGLRMALISSKIPFVSIRPQDWQKSLGIPRREENDTQTVWKNKLKARAQEMYPQSKVTLAIADAILIAEYCRRTEHTKEDSHEGKN